MPFLNIFWRDTIHLKLWILNSISSNSWSGALTESHWCQSQKSIFLTFGHKDFLRLDCPYFCLCGCHYSPFLLSHNCQSIKLVPEQLSNAMQHQHSCFKHNGHFHEQSAFGEMPIFVPKTVFDGTTQRDYFNMQWPNLSLQICNKLLPTRSLTPATVTISTSFSRHLHTPGSHQSSLLNRSQWVS